MQRKFLKNWWFEEKLTCGLENDMRNLTNFHQRWEVWKFGLSWDPFVQNRKCMSLKSTGELYVITMKNWTKIEEGLTCRFKIYMMNLTNFHLSTLKPPKFALQIGSFWPMYMFAIRKYRGVIFHDPEERCKIWRKTDLCFQKWHEEFDKFT